MHLIAFLPLDNVGYGGQLAGINFRHLNTHRRQHALFGAQNTTMKLGQRGSIFVIIGGILAIISSVDFSGNSIIPGQIKVLGGIALIVFGFGRLLFQNENKEEQKKNPKIALFIASLMAIGVVAYLYSQGSGPKKKLFTKTHGTFEVKLNNRTCVGNAILEGEKVTVQIKKIPTDIKIDGLRLYSKNIQIETKSIQWVCALMSDLRVIRCSTGLDLPKNNFEMFVDNGTYSISYWLKEPLENIRISDISFTILTDEGQPNIIIPETR